MSTRQNGMKGSLAPSSPPPNASFPHSREQRPPGSAQAAWPHAVRRRHSETRSRRESRPLDIGLCRHYTSVYSAHRHGRKTACRGPYKIPAPFSPTGVPAPHPGAGQEIHPADIVRTPEYPPQDSRDIVQHNVPELPPPRIVDPFKVIHINNKHRMGLAHVAFQKTQIYQMPNRHPIVASREAIPVRRFFLNQHGLLAFRHTHCPLYAVGRILSTSTLIAATPTGCRNRAPNPYSRTSGFSCGCDGLTLFKQ